MVRVLIADDDKDFLRVAKLLLTEAGYEVTVASSGADALCVAKACPVPDVLVLDMVMPNMDGHDVLRNLGDKAPPVVLITGDPVSDADFVSGKVARCLPKPFGARALLKAVSDALGRTTAADPPPELPAVIEASPAGGLEMTLEQWQKAAERIRRSNLDNPGDTCEAAAAHLGTVQDHMDAAGEGVAVAKAVIEEGKSDTR